jgi:glutathione peroxidase
MNTIYDYSALEFSGQEKSLKDYSGKVILIVNTASLCYFRRQFKSLEQLYQRYKDQGFEILAPIILCDRNLVPVSIWKPIAV